MDELLLNNVHLSDVIAATADPALSMASGGIQTITETLDMMNLPYAGSYVEIGCAAGWSTNRVASLRPDLRVIGIDPRDTAIATAREAAEDWRLRNIIYLPADARALPLPTSGFDGVFSGNVPAFVPLVDRPQLLRECGRIVADNGLIVAAPLYYPAALPPAEILDAVERVIGTEINRGPEQHWIALYESVGLHLVHRREHRFRANTDQEILAYVDRVMNSPTNRRHTPRVKTELHATLLALYRLFERNNRHLAYSLLAFQTHPRLLHTGLLLRSAD